MSGKKLTDVRKNGNIRRLSPDSKMQVTIACVLQVTEEIVEVVRFIPQERDKQRIVQ